MTHPQHSDLIAELQHWSRRIAEMPEPVAYIVLDHSWSHALPAVDGHDAKGRRYVLTSPAVLDEMRYVRVGEEPLNLSASIFGVPVFRRESLPEGWPDA